MNKQALPFLSIVIPTAGFGYESSDLLECLKSVTSLDYPAYEVIVVSEKPLDINYILAHVKPRGGEHLSIRFYTEGGGASRNRNKGIEVAQGDLVAFTDDDCVVDQQWLRCIIKALLKDPEVGAVCGKCLPLWKQDPPRYLKNSISKAIELNHVFGIEERAYLKEVHTVMGHNMAFKKKIFDKVGLFDPSLGPNVRKGYPLLRYYAGNDVEISLRLRRHGYKILYEPRAIVYHIIDWRKMTLRYILKQVWFIGRARFLRKKKYPEYGVDMQTGMLHLLTSISFRLVAFLLTRNLQHLVKAMLRLGFLIEKIRSLATCYS